MNPKFIFLQVVDDLGELTYRHLNMSLIREVIELKKDGTTRVVLLDGSHMDTPAKNIIGNSMFSYVGDQLK